RWPCVSCVSPLHRSRIRQELFIEECVFVCVCVCHRSRIRRELVIEECVCVCHRSRIIFVKLCIRETVCIIAWPKQTGRTWHRCLNMGNYLCVCVCVCVCVCECVCVSVCVCVYC